MMLRGTFVRQAEGGVKRGALNRGQFRDAPAHRAKELMQAGEWEICFGLNTSSHEHRYAPLPRRPRSIRREPGLTHTRLAANHRRLATYADPVQHRAQEVLLLSATHQGTSVSGIRSEHDVLILSLPAFAGEAR
jgi:hypothetical protein